MRNSFFVRLITSIYAFLKRSYFSSLTYKTFKMKDKKSKSSIVRKLMDTDVLADTKSYELIKKLEAQGTKTTTSSNVLNSLYLDNDMHTLVLTAVAILLANFALGFSIKRTLVLLILCILAKFFQVIVKNKYYESSLVYKFFTYAYRLER